MSIQTTHTPGPWIYDQNDRDDLQIKDERGRLIAEISDNRAFTLEQCQSNAKLIAILPELLDISLKTAEYLQTDNSTIGKALCTLLNVTIDKANK